MKGFNTSYMPLPLGIKEMVIKTDKGTKRLNYSSLCLYPKYDEIYSPYDEAIGTYSYTIYSTYFKISRDGKISFKLTNSEKEKYKENTGGNYDLGAYVNPETIELLLDTPFPFIYGMETEQISLADFINYFVHLKIENDSMRSLLKNHENYTNYKFRTYDNGIASFIVIFDPSEQMCDMTTDYIGEPSRIFVVDKILDNDSELDHIDITINMAFYEEGFIKSSEHSDACIVYHDSDNTYKSTIEEFVKQYYYSMNEDICLGVEYIDKGNIGKSIVDQYVKLRIQPLSKNSPIMKRIISSRLFKERTE